MLATMLQYHHYDTWKNVAVVPPDKETDLDFLFSAMRDHALDQLKGWGRATVISCWMIKPKHTKFENLAIAIFVQERHEKKPIEMYCPYRVVKVLSDDDTLEIGEAPLFYYPYYTETRYTPTMRHWMTNMALDPDQHAIRCLACVFQSQYESDHSSEFGLYSVDTDSENEKVLKAAQKFVHQFGIQKAYQVIEQYMDVYEADRLLSESLGVWYYNLTMGRE